MTELVRKMWADAWTSNSTTNIVLPYSCRTYIDLRKGHNATDEGGLTT